LIQGGGSVAGLGHHVNPVEFLDTAAKPLAHDRVIIRHHNSYSVIRHL
jgi:hypothetical protein